MVVVVVRCLGGAVQRCGDASSALRREEEWLVDSGVEPSESISFALASGDDGGRLWTQLARALCRSPFRLRVPGEEHRMNHK